MNILEVTHLSKEFNLHILNNKRIESLKDINFTMKEGEIIGLTGKSGSGKSSLMKCLYRTYLASTGEIIYLSKNGAVDLVKADDHRIIDLRKNEITYCSQFLSVIPRVAAIDVVCENLFRVEKDKDFARSQSKNMLEQLGLPYDLWDAFPVTFSGGEQQRINVARAIIAKPRFLLIDEPTASLDAKTKDVVVDMILRLKAEGTSVLVISHDEYTLDRLCDRRIDLKFGEIISEEMATNQ
ncbi:phosphonate C-P lyase system protein PhnL [Mucilaginibacter polytrichastri]|uniref:Phosphonates transport ATP-binding protein PhnL n=1 Tax=Mucilaginibacter polytrichastri TaxID=1302689 RepID=A0A1Q5ZZG9_9SPHI|nr:ATP-binding cassette domain-containing protein [Mucilaginibacter polytrichastri]OKS87147.1 Phosphonates transport ATP-binding protein PhnL [Mucilaginibacter polytrichastri]SFS88063.1 alpha-D-ribose 1-methylphosphonate 5-triphosphate synthase subunit PhnL [Mucilaginibacter polytrichastri]